MRNDDTQAHQLFCRPVQFEYGEDEGKYERTTGLIAQAASSSPLSLWQGVHFPTALTKTRL
jgi:hypothetical protein